MRKRAKMVRNEIGLDDEAAAMGRKLLGTPKRLGFLADATATRPKHLTKKLKKKNKTKKRAMARSFRVLPLRHHRDTSTC